ncbi:MAG: hypothetical protein RR185_06680, partial [Angelakisella sp.]
TGGNVIKKGSIDSTVDPCKVLFLGQGQSITAPESWITDGWVTRDSLALPLLGDDQAARIAALKSENARLAALVDQIKRLVS